MSRRSNSIPQPFVPRGGQLLFTRAPTLPSSAQRRIVWRAYPNSSAASFGFSHRLLWWTGLTIRLDTFSIHRTGSRSAPRRRFRRKCGTPTIRVQREIFDKDHRPVR